MKEHITINILIVVITRSLFIGQVRSLKSLKYFEDDSNVRVRKYITIFEFPLRNKYIFNEK